MKRKNPGAERVTVLVPATTANLGPGFDCLGMALDIYNEVSLEISEPFHIAIADEGATTLSQEKDNIVYQGIVAAYRRSNNALPPLRLTCLNRIPLARGLGSSAAAVVGGLVAANLLLGEPLSPEDLLQLAAEMEGHADNVAPALFGGCQISFRQDNRVLHTPVPFPQDLQAVLFIPDFEMPTGKSRALLSPQVSRADAVFNLGRVALLITAFTTGKLGLLRLATQDRLHQPARQLLFPAMESLFQAALEAGALGAFLSGGGSTVLALANKNAPAIEEAMLTTAREKGISGKARIARPSLLGAHRVEKKGEIG